MPDVGEPQLNDGTMRAKRAIDEHMGAQLARLARRLYEVHAELSAMLGLSPLASNRVTRELALPELLAHVETLEVRLAMLSASLRHARPMPDACSTSRP